MENEITYKITDQNGIHARPAGLIVQTARQYEASATLSIGGKSADCKKLFQLMQLGVRQGDEVRLTATGTDSREAVAGIERTMREAGL